MNLLRGLKKPRLARIARKIELQQPSTRTRPVDGRSPARWELTGAMAVRGQCRVVGIDVAGGWQDEFADQPWPGSRSAGCRRGPWPDVAMEPAGAWGRAG